MIYEESTIYQEAPWYIYYSTKTNEPCIIQADNYDLYDYEDDLFLSHKKFASKEEAQLGLDHLTLIVYPDRLLQLARWIKAYA